MKLLVRLVIGYSAVLAVSLFDTSSTCCVSSFAPLGGAVRSSEGQEQNKQFFLQGSGISSSSNALAAASSTTNEQSASFLPALITQNASSLSVAIASFITYLLNNRMALGPIQASSIVGLFAAVTLPDKLALAAVCGSFAGMARTTVIPTPAAAMSLSVLCAVVMKVFDQQAWFIGFGGRLGFISQCACTIQFLLQKYVFTSAAIFGTTSASAKLMELSLYYSDNNAVIVKTVSNIPLLVISTIAGAFFMRLWKQIMGRIDRIPSRFASSATAVSITGLLASVVSPLRGIAGPIFCGSFVAMAGPQILGGGTTTMDKKNDPRPLVLASALAGIVQWAMAGVLLGGWGGRLGTAAFGGVLAYRILWRCYNAMLDVLSSSSDSSDSDSETKNA